MRHYFNGYFYPKIDDTLIIVNLILFKIKSLIDYCHGYECFIFVRLTPPIVDSSAG